MSSSQEDDEEVGWRPSWETDDEVEFPGPLSRRGRCAIEPDYTHPLLTPLARAQDAIARLETRAWKRHRRLWLRAWGRGWPTARRQAGLPMHTSGFTRRYLALRDAGLTGSYGAAARAGRLERELPTTAARGSEFDVVPSDSTVELALQLARLWRRRLAEFRTWMPLADAGAMRETLQSLGYRDRFADAEAEDWLASCHNRQQWPALIWAGRAAQEWMNRPGTEPLSPNGIFLAACLWREKGFGRAVSLPFWSAPGAASSSAESDHWP